MNQTQKQLASLSMNLKRAALGFNRNSIAMANRFVEESWRELEKIDFKKLPSSIRKLVLGTKSILSRKDSDRIAEDMLMYSTLFQNAALKGY